MGHKRTSGADQCPLYPRKRTLEFSRVMSALRHKRTHAVQQLDDDALAMTNGRTTLPTKTIGKAEAPAARIKFKMTATSVRDFFAHCHRDRRDSLSNEICDRACHREYHDNAPQYGRPNPVRCQSSDNSSEQGPNSHYDRRGPDHLVRE
jgi:hypothetical protein